MKKCYLVYVEFSDGSIEGVALNNIESAEFLVNKGLKRPCTRMEELFLEEYGDMEFKMKVLEV